MISLPDTRGGPKPDSSSAHPEHVLTVSNREHLLVSGVSAVDSFDDHEVILQTDLGTLTIQGEELHIKQLDLESGRFAVDGVVNVLSYSLGMGRGNPRRHRSLLERLLK